ncbi:GDSL-type esterase/lipase family protein [Streptomyces sp. MSC1_001]|uniref:GDSL-type esterase/lipase family protein n=1 Tax=Streptomyces sp. MSC1_001 TaxID=2909263 RepID=UPI002030B56E|nr:GDSL-type esterase/lipase family protein [Streptomyces sp. MSC1_001]
MRFLFVGDSMTIGRAGDWTWRYRMWRHLESTLPGGYEVVGPRTRLYEPAADAPVSDAYADPDFPAHARRHLAGWGEGWLHMAPVIGETVAATGADVLLISLGLIDLGFYTDSAQTHDNVRAFVTAARAANPRVRAVLLPVIPNVRAGYDAPFAAECARFNELLAKAVADLDTAASPLLLATVPASYDLGTDTYDGTHPGPSGEHKLAAAFADAMHRAWGLGGPYGPAEDARSAVQDDQDARVRRFAKVERV